ncbi:three-Cys-motif partner protein TcmP [Paenibacillus sp. OK076]|uniref:three-Cys-motif partner protein TcmP n=1 Tax=Paenibacillus sp. OK076 TaxID=1884379 RepID=UPI0008B71871|nr:three-Cys-motif partner protein TcmP [Paenibacillus sp. OK076]SEO10592.1 three-Cys-motif partner protein [Paenibacillus sp. OK076]
MSQPETTLWELEPHTEAKHIILRNYLRAWFPIMGQYNSRILFLDGYSGPGQYDNGEDGSPIIAIKEAMQYLDSCDKRISNKPEIAEIVMIFIEENTERAIHLQERIDSMEIHKKINVQVVNSNFEDTANDILQELEKSKAQLAPAFLFVDPFGYNLSFELIQKLMDNPKCEVFINFMYEFINRFIRRIGQEAVMTKLFGNEDWKQLDLDCQPEERRELIHGLYQQQLIDNTAKYVRSFEMKGKRNSTKYFLFYGTNHKKGLLKMKDAMWSVDTGGTYTFSDATNPLQGVLFGNEPNYEYLKDLLLLEFKGKTATIEEIEDYVLCSTPFRTTHIKLPILKPMEQNQELRILTDRKRRWTYPAGTIIEIF